MSSPAKGILCDPENGETYISPPCQGEISQNQRETCISIILYCPVIQQGRIDFDCLDFILIESSGLLVQALRWHNLWSLKLFLA